MPETPPEHPARLTARFQPALNAALWQNNVPVLSELAIANISNEQLSDIEIELTCVPPVLPPRTWHVAGIRPGIYRTIEDLDIPVDGQYLSGLTEATRGTVTLKARSADDVIAEFSQDIRILAFNEWGGTAGIPDILAAFVQPNDPAIARILHAASDLLREAGKPDSFEGYQGPKARVWEQAQAIWSAVSRMDVRYINPPPSFVGGGQRIRSARQITEDRFATCIDLAVLFCSCLEAAGLRPLIILQREHAFAGLWLSKGDFGQSAVDDAPGMRTRLKLDDLLLFETTLVTHTPKPSFRQAIAAGAEHALPAKDPVFESLIDIHRARQRRILPLASHVTGYALQPGAPESVPAELPGLEDAPPLRDEMRADDGPPPTTAEGRLDRWRKRLLDLSGRNRLLNMPASGRQVLWIDCPDPAGLEDRLAAMRGAPRATPLRFRPWPDLMNGADPRSAALHRNRLHEDANQAFAREALAKGELLVGRDDAALQVALTEIYRKARADQQEGGANTLYLTIGTLLWRQKDRDTPYRAPLILVPVVLERPSVRSGFVLRTHDDETRLNATLLEMLRQEFAIRFPALEAERPPEDEAGLDVAAIIDIVRSKLRDIKGWEVEDGVGLTTLSFTKFLMWKDLSDRADALRVNPIARRLMDGPTADKPPAALGQNTPGQDTRPEGGALDDMLATAALHCPLEGDSSQLRAVARAAAKESFVLIGPPGTGKSQTIANIIANTLAQGRTVLFVAEKRAALEVVQRRLNQVGLADFCLDLFSSKASKTAVLGQLDRAQSAIEVGDDDAWSTAQINLTALQQELNVYVRELHKRWRNGWTPFRAIGTVLRASDSAVPDIALSWPHAEFHTPGDWQRLVETVEEARNVLVRSARAMQEPALAGIEQPQWSPLWQARLLNAAAQAVQQIETAGRAAKAVAAILGLTDQSRSRPALRHLTELAGLLASPIGPQAAWAATEDAGRIRDAMQEAAKQVERHRHVKQALTGTWRPGVFALPLTTLRAEWRSAAEKWALPRSLARRAVRKQLATQAEAPVPDECGPELDRLIELADIDAALKAMPEAAALGRTWRALETDFPLVEAAHAWGQRLRIATSSCVTDPQALIALRTRLRQLLAEGADLLAPTGAVGSALNLLLESWAELEARLDTVSKIAGMPLNEPVSEDRDDWLQALSGLLTGWATASRLIQDWCAWRGVAQPAEALGLGPLMQALQQGLVRPDDALRALEANYARWWIDHAVDGSPGLRGFVASRHETRIERFRALDVRIQQTASRMARARITASIPGAVLRQADPEYALLTRELAKKQRHLPVRQLAQRMPHALRRLTPCLMMSPLSVAQYLPAESEPFDLVIFDEASQITTWDAIGAIGRGHQVIVTGDPKQLPPTNFFQRATGQDDGAAVAMDTEELDSILDECLGAGIPAIELTWHYRSRHESLIAFSNQTYYGARLVTFPSPVTQDDAVSFRYVPTGIYARGGARTNEVEARAVVAEALAVLRAPQPRSLGIVTFNAEQQSLVEDLLDKARRDDPALERFFADDAAEPVLIKNLEGVQGEERDVMLFSLTYGPDPTGRIALNFGPLNLSGGERRLNVAVTRARERLIVFGSLRAEQLDLSRTSAVGVRHLKRFLEFAEHGARAFATATDGPGGEHESPFEEQVAVRLARRGWAVHPQVGVSGFRIDLGVVDPEAPGTYLAGLECDGATYHRGATARDRDRLRQHVLEGLGWRILRVWSTDWWTNADRETERLDRQLHEILETVRSARAARAHDDAPDQPAAPEPALPEPPNPEPATQPTTDTEATQADAATDSLPEAAEPGPEPGLAGMPGESFYEPGYRNTLALLVAQVLNEHGPLREDRLVQAIARRHGFKRAGREIRERVVSLVPADSVVTAEEAGRFIWPPNVDPGTWNRFRTPRPGVPADPMDLPLSELTVLARQCLAQSPSEETALLAMRDACGLQRLRETARARCLAALASARGA